MKWFGDTAVILATTFWAVEITVLMRWWARKTTNMLMLVVHLPSQLITVIMRGVDSVDTFLSAYCIRKVVSPHHLAFFDLCVVQTWIWHKQNVITKLFRLKECKVSAANCLLYEENQ